MLNGSLKNIRQSPEVLILAQMHPAIQRVTAQKGCVFFAGNVHLPLTVIHFPFLTVDRCGPCVCEEGGEDGGIFGGLLLLHAFW